MKINGSVKSVKTINGNVTVMQDIGLNVETVNGNVSAAKICGSVSTVNGEINGTKI